jgi:hypothetical protein
MTIENRDLPVGTKLQGTHKKTTYICEVVEIPGGGTRFMLADGRLFSSPSSAGKAVMNGISCNGCPCGIQQHWGSGTSRSPTVVWFSS